MIMIRKKFHGAVSLLDRCCEIALGAVMLTLFAVLLLQIISRFLVFLPIPWSQDMITFLLVCTVFLGVGSATGRGKQIRLEFFTELFPERMTAAILIFADLVSIVFLGVLTGQAMQLGRDNLTVHMGTSLVAFGWYYAVVAFGCAVMILNFMDLILMRIDVLTGQKKSAGEEGEE